MRISRIYRGLLDYGIMAGRPATHVLIAGAELTCSVDGPCQPSKQGGEEINQNELAALVREQKLKRVYFCGGEPLIYDELDKTMQLLVHAGFEVWVETSLTIELNGYSPLIHKLVDIKCPSNGTCHQANWRNTECLSDRDSAVFIISDWNDYVWASDVCRREKLSDFLPVQFTARPGELSFDELAGWMIKDGLDIQLQKPLNIHLSKE